jgi:hypothetical protein
MKCYEYLAGDNWAEPNGGIYIKQLLSDNIKGDRHTLGDMNVLAKNDKWKVVGHVPSTDEAIGEVNAGSGILTGGQFQCMCIIVAIFENERSFSKHGSRTLVPNTQMRSMV